MNQISFNYQKLDFQLAVEGHPVETHYLSHNQEQVPLTFVACDYGESQDVAFHLDYGTDFFDGQEAAAILDRIHGLLRQVATEKDLEIHRYRLPTDSEWQKLVVEWNATASPLRHDACLHEFFEEQALRTPDSVAVVSGTECLTYRELNDRANQIAIGLIELGAGPERLIGVCHGRSPNLLVAILGILKAGAAYVPLDPAYPSARIRHILDDARVATVLADSNGSDALAGGACTVVDVGELLRTCTENGSPVRNVPKHELGLTAANLAYVIYTSGSTGGPKGVMIEHRNVAAFVQWALEAYSDEDLAGVLAATSVCFDLSVFEMFVPLAKGGRVVLVDNVLALGNSGLGEVSLINTVPSAIKVLLDAKAIPRSVRCINLAGELLRQDLVDALYELPGVRVHDLYGPSEDTTYSTWCLRRKHGHESIGRPISNTQIYVLDSHGNPLPTGMVGELHIGGAGLARGYLNDETRSNEKFILNGNTNSRLYRTGDLVRFDRDGDLRYIGRKDNQVKIRGYRIELGEIEAQILQHPAVNDCVVIAHEDEGAEARKVLLAYVVIHERDAGTAMDELKCTEALIGLLSSVLPGYMVPSQFVHLHELPLTPNGKVDRNALPAPGHKACRQERVTAPRNDTEQRLCEIWKSILRVGDVGARDNFFALGGDSLLLMRVATAIEGAFKVKLGLPELFASATVESQAGLLEQAHNWTLLLDEVSATTEECSASHVTL